MGIVGGVGHNITGIRDERGRTVGRKPASATMPSTSYGLYEAAQQELSGIKDLYQPGGAYDQAFGVSQRRASDMALAQSVQSGMFNVYNPEASGAAFEAENRGQWELGRTQGLAGAMAGVAGLQAQRGSELYQGDLRRELTGMNLAMASRRNVQAQQPRFDNSRVNYQAPLQFAKSLTGQGQTQSSGSIPMAAPLYGASGYVGVPGISEASQPATASNVSHLWNPNQVLREQLGVS